MAEKKNFIIENYNGTDYDTLYPETNSGQVLLDSVAQEALNLESGKTLDDVIGILGNVNDFDNRYDVGDVFTTARTNLSDKWTLCNGDVAVVTEYPELAKELPVGYLNFRRFNVPNSIGQSYTNACLIAKERDGIKEAILYLTIGSSNASYYINLSDGSSPITALHATPNMYSANNIFIVSRGNAAWWCDGDPTVEASWHTMSNISEMFNDVLYKNGKYYILGDDDLYIYTSLDSTPQTVNIKTLTGHNTTAISSKIGVDGDNIIIIDRVGTTSSAYQYYADIINPNGGLVSSTNIQRLSTGNIYLLTKFSNGYLLVSSSGCTYSQTLSGTFASITNNAPQSLSYSNSVVDELYVILSNNKYIDSQLNIRDAVSPTDGDIDAVSISNENIYTLYGYNPAKFYFSPKSESFSIPSYSPADGLRAYIKTKN